MREYDLVVIGGGIGGYTAAIEATKNGLKVAIIEKEFLGGTCLNKGCIPTKALIHSAELFHEVKNNICGITYDNLKVDQTQFYERKNAIVLKLRKSLEQLIKSNNIDCIYGNASFIDNNIIRIEKEDAENIKGDLIIVATGSEVAKLNIDGIELAYNSDDILTSNIDIKDNIVIVGGGVIGVEFASMWALLGKNVTVIEYADKILNTLESDISTTLNGILKKQGVKFITSAKVSGFKKDGDGYNVKYLKDETNLEVKCDMIVVCVGRSPNVDTLRLESAGVEYTKKGIKINENCVTNISNIYAVGDVTGGIQLAHYASAMAVKAVEYMLSLPSSLSLEYIPSCVYTAPEVATVGLSAEKCLQKGLDITVAKIPISGNGKSIIANRERGFIKIVIDKLTGRLYGATLVCDRATDIIGELCLAITNGLTKDDFMETIHPHPTVVEAIIDCLKSVE